MFKIYRHLEKNEFIVVGVDTSMGLGDYVAAHFLSKTKLDIPIVYHSPATITEFTPLLHQALEKIYDETGIKPIVALERQNGGAFEMDRLGALNRLNKYDLFKMPLFGRDNPPEAVKYGWDTTTATRPKMLQDLKEAIDKQIIRVYDKETVNELFSFVKVQTTSLWKAQAERGAKDDLVMSLGISYQLYLNCDLPISSKPVSYEVKQTVKNISKKMSGFY